jgi:hypothetical protein
MDNFYWNLCFDKSRIKTFISWYLLNNGEFKTVALLDQLKNFGFESATKAGISLGIDDLKIPPQKKGLLYEAEIETTIANQKYKRGDILGVEKFQRLISSWHRVSETLKTEVVRHFEDTNTLNPVYMMAFSGARGNISQVRQLVGMRGLMSDPQGRIIDFPILRNFREGLTLTEYLISCFGARKGIVDTALRTANAGYLTRRLVDVAHHVIISQFDCGTIDSIGITPMKEGTKYIYTLQNRLIGRIAAETIIHEGKVICSKNDELTQELALKISSLKTKVFIRSPLTCDSKNLVCQLCYGWSLADGRLVSIGETVGIIAAQSIGEPGTQLTMRTFHTGGVFTSDVSDQIKAPYNGIVDFDAPIPGSLVRTAEGKIGFLTKTDGGFCIRQSSLIPNGQIVATPLLTKYKIPALTLLFIRHQQRVTAKELIAQITSLNQQTAQRDNSEQTLLSELEGEVLFANIRYRQSSETDYGSSNPSKGITQDGTSIKLRAAKMEVWTMQKQKTEVIGERATTHLTKDRLDRNTENPRNIKFPKNTQIGNIWLLSGKIYQFPIKTKTFLRTGDYITKKTPLNEIIWYKTGSSLTIQKTGEILIPNTFKQTNVPLRSFANRKQNARQYWTSPPQTQIFESFIYRKRFLITKISYKKYGYLLKLNHKKRESWRVGTEAKNQKPIKREKNESFLFLTTAFANETIDAELKGSFLNKKTAYDVFNKTNKEAAMTKGQHASFHMYDHNMQTETGGIITFENVARFGDLLFTAPGETESLKAFNSTSGTLHETNKRPLETGKWNFQTQNKKIENWVKKAIFVKNILKIEQKQQNNFQVYSSQSKYHLDSRHKASANAYYKQFPLSKKEILINDSVWHNLAIPRWSLPAAQLASFMARNAEYRLLEFPPGDSNRRNPRVTPLYSARKNQYNQIRQNFLAYSHTSWALSDNLYYIAQTFHNFSGFLVNPQTLAGFSAEPSVRRLPNDAAEVLNASRILQNIMPTSKKARKLLSSSFWNIRKNLSPKVIPDVLCTNWNTAKNTTLLILNRQGFQRQQKSMLPGQPSETLQTRSQDNQGCLILIKQQRPVNQSANSWNSIRGISSPILGRKGGADNAYSTRTALNLKHFGQNYNIQVKKGFVYLPRDITRAFTKHKSFCFPGQQYIDNLLFSTNLYSECFKLTPENQHSALPYFEQDCFVKVIITNPYCRFNPQIIPSLPLAFADSSKTITSRRPRMHIRLINRSSGYGSDLPLGKSLSDTQRNRKKSACRVTNFFVLIRNRKTIKQWKEIDQQRNLSKFYTTCSLHSISSTYNQRSLNFSIYHNRQKRKVCPKKSINTSPDYYLRINQVPTEALQVPVNHKLSYSINRTNLFVTRLLADNLEPYFIKPEISGFRHSTYASAHIENAFHKIIQRKLLPLRSLYVNRNTFLASWNLFCSIQKKILNSFFNNSVNVKPQYVSVDPQKKSIVSVLGHTSVCTSMGLFTFLRNITIDKRTKLYSEKTQSLKIIRPEIVNPLLTNNFHFIFRKSMNFAPLYLSTTIMKSNSPIQLQAAHALSAPFQQIKRSLNEINMLSKSLPIITIPSPIIRKRLMSSSSSYQLPGVLALGIPYYLNPNCFLTPNKNSATLQFFASKNIPLGIAQDDTTSDSNSRVLVRTQNSIISNVEYPIALAKTDFLSPFEGEVIAEKQRTTKVELLILTKKDLYSYRNTVTVARKRRLTVWQNNKPLTRLRKICVGRFLKFGDVLTKRNEKPILCKETGQIIHINNQIITIRRSQYIAASHKAILHVTNNQWLEKTNPVITLPFQRLKAGDIVQGIPKIEQFFEARKRKAGRFYSDSIPNLMNAIYNQYLMRYQFDTNCLTISAKKAILKVQQILVNGIQRVYRTQGVSIADKHIEIIVRQMTSKVRILNPGLTAFLPGELIDVATIFHLNLYLIEKVHFEPIVLGITQASLQVESFISAASFQQTTRVLCIAAIEKKQDYLRGLKENIILGNLMPAGTGFVIKT